VTSAAPHIPAEIEAARARASRRLRLRERTARFALGVGFIAVAFPLARGAVSERTPSLWLVGFLILAYAVASRIEVEVGGALALPTQLALVPMLFLVPVAKVPLCVAVGLIVGALPDVRRGTLPPERLATIFTRAWHALGPAFVLLAAGQPGAGLSGTGVSHWAVFAAALGAQFGVDLAVRSLRGWIGYGISPFEQLWWLPALYGFDALLAPLGLVVAWQARSEPWAVLALVPLLGLVAGAARLRPAVAASLIRDTKPGEAVRLSLAVADELGLHGRDQRDVELTALLHRVGRTRLPRSILEKPGPLTTDEWAIVQTHTVEAEKLLARHGGRLGEVGTYVRSCSERWDGGGYPDGLHGRDIPLIARIVAVCGAYEAMTSERSYRKALTPAQARDELRTNAGTQFDPRVVEALLRRVDAA
jgi:hypothetical protein